MEKNEYTPTTPQERAALAEAREREARRQKALAAGSASPRQAGYGGSKPDCAGQPPPPC